MKRHLSSPSNRHNLQAENLKILSKSAVNFSERDEFVVIISTKILCYVNGYVCVCACVRHRTFWFIVFNKGNIYIIAFPSKDCHLTRPGCSHSITMAWNGRKLDLVLLKRNQLCHEGTFNSLRSWGLLEYLFGSDQLNKQKLWLIK